MCVSRQHYCSQHIYICTTKRIRLEPKWKGNNVFCVIFLNGFYPTASEADLIVFLCSAGVDVCIGRDWTEWEKKKKMRKSRSVLTVSPNNVSCAAPFTHPSRHKTHFLGAGGETLLLCSGTGLKWDSTGDFHCFGHCAVSRHRRSVMLNFSLTKSDLLYSSVFIKKLSFTLFTLSKMHLEMFFMFRRDLIIAASQRGPWKGKIFI